MKSGLVIGKRIPAGQIIGGIISVAAFFHNMYNPEMELPAHVVVAITTVAIGIAQIYIVNKFGVTPE